MKTHCSGFQYFNSWHYNWPWYEYTNTTTTSDKLNPHFIDNRDGRKEGRDDKTKIIAWIQGWSRISNDSAVCAFLSLRPGFLLNCVIWSVKLSIAWASGSLQSIVSRCSISYYISLFIWFLKQTINRDYAHIFLRLEHLRCRGARPHQ